MRALLVIATLGLFMGCGSRHLRVPPDECLVLRERKGVIIAVGKNCSVLRTYSN